MDRFITEVVLKEQARKSHIHHTRAGKQILVTSFPVFNDTGERFAGDHERTYELTRLRMELERPVRWPGTIARKYPTC